jgi:hypothetical protein
MASWVGRGFVWPRSGSPEWMPCKGRMKGECRVIYNVLGIRTPGEPPDIHYPSLGEKLLPEFYPVDGQPEHHKLNALSVSRLRGGESKRVIGTEKVSADLWLTDERVVVCCSNYNVAHWSGENNINSFIWGRGLETTDFLITKAVHRVQARGKAMVGHVHLPWITTVGYQPHRRFKQVGAVTVRVNSKLTDGTVKTLSLELRLDNSEDPRAVAERLFRRTCEWWLKHGEYLSDAARQRFQQGVTATFNDPDVGKMALLHLPQSRPTKGS